MLTLLLLGLACSPEKPSAEASSDKAVVTETSSPQRRACSGPKSRPDVVIVSIDTLRADRLGYAGYTAARTPHLDALAQSGAVFSQATTPVPRTTPALASLMTGLSPHHHGAREVGEMVLAPQRLSTLLAESGWRTVGISAMPVAGPDQDMDRGFDFFEVHADARSEDLTRVALEQAAAVPENCPLFLWTHFADPHFPYLPPKSWSDQPVAPKCRPVVEKASKGKMARYKYYANRNGRSEPILEDCSALYDAEIAYADHGVGQLLSGLAAQGREQPIIVFTSDHGENLGEWGLFFEHGPNGHDASLRIPLVIAGPGVAPASYSTPATLEDVAPTVLQLAGVTPPDEMNFDGRSLLDRNGPAPEWIRAESGSALHARLSDYLVAGRKHRLHCIHGPQYSLCDSPKRKNQLFNRNQDPDLKRNIFPKTTDTPEDSKLTAIGQRLRDAWKPWPIERTRQRLIRTSTHMLIATPQVSGDYALALYDHTSDPGLLKNLLDQQPEVAAKLKPILTSWQSELDEANRPISERTQEQEEALRALGYIE